MQDVIIRRAGTSDAEALARIGRETFTETFGHLYPAHDLATFLDEAYGLDATRQTLRHPHKAAWLVMQADGEVVGHALAGPCDLPHPEVTPEAGEVKRLYLRARAQGGGLGARLFETVIAWLEETGRQDIWLGVWSLNHGAQHFYRRYGFSPIGEYGFPVGAVVDREFIFRRSAQIF